jgi:hypothetical protein
MKKKLFRILLSVVLVAQAFAYIPAFEGGTVQAAGKVYYVDADGGKDSNAGTSQNAAWKTLSKVNQTTFQPGDKILFQCGDSWNGMLSPKGSGSKNNVITIGSYGSGNKPVIDGKGAEAAVKLDGQEYWTISEICAKNTASDRAIRQGIYVNGKSSGITHDISIKDCEVCDVKGENRRALPTYESMYWNSGIYVSMPGRSNSGKHYDGVLIENNYVHDVTTSGIRINQREDFIVDPYHTNVLIQYNTIERTGSDGMIVANCVSPLVQYNKCYDAGALGNSNDTKIIAGMWACGTSNAVFQFNEVARTRLFESDGTAFDTDWGTGGTTIFQYNYTHENGGGFWLDCAGINKDPSHVKTILRYNVSVDDERYLIRAGDMETEVYNNTFYKSAGTLDACFGNAGTNHRFWNNIFYFNSMPDWASSYYDNNLYYGCSNSDKDSAAINGDPLFVNAGPARDGMEYAKNFALQSGSPCVGKGAYISQNGGKDFSGNALNASSNDIGAIQTGLVVSDEDEYNLERSYASTQGHDGWYTYTEQNGSYVPMSWNAEDERWHGVNTYNLVWAPGRIHPDANATAIGWQAQKTGTIRLTGNPRKVDTGNDGIRVKIMKNDQQIWPASDWQTISGNDKVGVKYDFTTAVNAGDMIYFVVDKNQTTYNDGAYWNPCVSYNVQETYAFESGFSNVQGQNNWKYLTRSGDAYSEMTWNDGDQRWHGANTYSLVWKPAQLHPDGVDTVLAWTAPHSGTVVIEGTPRKANTGYDGVNVRILKNSEQLWPASGWQKVEGNDTRGVSHSVTIDVNEGDVIYFELNQNGNNYADETYWNPTVSYR